MGIPILRLQSGMDAGWDKDPDKTVRLEKDQRWSGILQEIFQGEYEVIEEGLPSRTTSYTDPVYSYLEGRSYITPCILSHSPIDVLIIMLGTNDLKVAYSPTESSISKGMEGLLKVVMNPCIWEHQRIPHVLIVAPPTIRENIQDSPFFGLYDEKSVEISKSCARCYEILSEKYGCSFLDGGAVAESSALDCIHMNPENHRKLAEAVAAKIREMS